MFSVVPEYRKLPPLDTTCSVAGTLVTLNTSEADCADVSSAVVKMCCVDAPFCAVPFSVNCTRLVSGREAAFCGAAVPLKETK